MCRAAETAAIKYGIIRLIGPKAKYHKAFMRHTGLAKKRGCLNFLLFAGLADICDVGEEVVVLRLGHGLAELRRVLEHADEDLQTVEVRVLGGDHLKNCLKRSTN